MSHSTPTRTLPLLAPLGLLLPLVFLASCGGSGGGGGSDASLDLTLEDAPLEGLLAFRARADSLVLLREDGTTTDELLSSPAEVEFLGLQDRSLWLDRVSIPSGRYSGAILGLDAERIEAIDLDGRALRVNVTSDRLVTTFDEVRSLSGHERLRIDLDVGASLRGTVDSPPLEFVPVGRAFLDEGERRALEAFHAVYEGLADDGVLVRPLRGQDDVPAREVQSIVVDADTVLVSDRGLAPDLTQWSEGLASGRSRIEVLAELGPGAEIFARRLVVLSLDGENGEACVEGLLLGLDAGSLRILVQEVDHDRTWELLRQRSDDPQRPNLVHDDATAAFDRSGQPTEIDRFEPGQRIRVCLELDDGRGPLRVSRAEVEALASLHGVVVDDGGLPAEVLVRLSPDDFWVREGLIDAAQDVRLDLRDARFGLDGAPDVLVEPSDVGLDSTLIAHGSLTGLRQPEFVSRHVLLRAGAFEGCVVDADPGRSRFEARVSRLLSPFRRGQERPELLEVLTRPSTRFEGAAGDSDRFYEIWSNLPSDQVLRVTVRGFQRPRGLVVASVVQSELGPVVRDAMELWPPNHRLVAFDLRCEFDLRDDEGRPLTEVVVTAITQDEPVNGRGDGNTAPDAQGIGGDVISVRAERAGGGNGRVYRIQYEARDGAGDPIQGSVRLSVPHSQNGDRAVDDGQDYSSTEG